MNFYAFHIGDYAGATRHLSWDEDMAYRRMLDAYYTREAPLPKDRKALYRLVGAADKRQREAVDSVLTEFFTDTPDGWRNVRCEEEIDATNAKKAKAAESARKRWEAERAMQDAVAAQSERNANAMRTHMPTHSEGNAPTPNPNPNPNVRGEVVARARDPDSALVASLREAAGWQSDPSPNLEITGEIQALLDSGADLELDVLPTIRALAPQCDGRSWRYFVKPIARQRDSRIAAATVVSMPTTTPRVPYESRQQKPSRADTFAAIRRRIDDIAVAETDGEAARDGHGSSRDIAEGSA